MGGPATQAALEAAAKATWEKLKKPAQIPHWSTVYRWRRNLINAGRDIHAVVSKVSKRGNRKRQYPQEVLTIIEDAIESVYLTREKKTRQDVLNKANEEVNRENKLRPKEAQLREPTYRLVTSMIGEVPAFDRCLAREGRTVAVRRFRSVLGHRTTEMPLQRAEIDHTLMDLMVIDDHSGLPLGRPVLTACLDDYTRCVLGINIGFEPPNFLTVARCLKNAFMPKTNLKAQYPEVINDWEAHGVMRELSMDNGAEFHSISLEEGCYSLGIEIHYSPRKMPWFKGKIERFQGTLNREVAHVSPGTTFSNIFDKEDYDPVKHAVVRLSTLQHIVRKWIVDVYHQRPHRSLKVPPAAMWKSSINAEDIQLPETPDMLDAILGRREHRALTHKGIEFEGLLYNSPDMTTLRMQLGERLDVEICVDDGDIGKIVVLSPDKKRMFVVPALAQIYAKGMTAWQHKVCKRYATKEMQKYDSTAWLKAKERIAEMIRNEMALKKSRTKTNSRAARYMEGAKQPPVPPASAPSAATDAPPAATPTLPPAAPTSSQAAKLIALPAPTPRFAPVVRQRT
jgi:putative transposase